MLPRVDISDNKFSGQINNQHSSVFGKSDNDEAYNLYSRLLSGLNLRSNNESNFSGKGSGTNSDSNFLNSLRSFFSGIGSAIGGGINALGKSLFDAGVFISQLLGFTNTNEDAPNNNSNCGPATVAMLLGDFGIEKTDASGADAEIDHIRRDDMNAGTNEMESTSTRQIAFALSKHGLNTKEYHGGATTDDIDQELEKGNEIIVNVNTIAGGWGNAKKHFVVVVDKDDFGNYIIKDPLDNSARPVSQKQMKDAMDDRGGFMVASGNGNRPVPPKKSEDDNQIASNHNGWDLAHMDVDNWNKYFGLS